MYIKPGHVDRDFILDFPHEAIDPTVVNEAKQCVWKYGMVATHEELKEESSSRLLISQSWFKDIDEQYGAPMQKEFANKKGYANTAAIIDLDVTQSINTMNKMPIL